MPRRFNTAGPCDPVKHYMLPPERRLPGVRDLIDQEHYPRAPYAEAAAQLVFMAFLHKVVNGGGFIDCEFAVGSGRVDLSGGAGLQRQADCGSSALNGMKLRALGCHYTTLDLPSSA